MQKGLQHLPVEEITGIWAWQRGDVGRMTGCCLSITYEEVSKNHVILSNPLIGRQGIGAWQSDEGEGTYFETKEILSG